MFDFIVIILACQIMALLPIANLQKLFSPLSLVFSLPAFLWILYRDFPGGKSPGKRLLGIKVIDKDGNPIGFFGSILRNLSTLIWPMEFIALILTGKRISDTSFHFQVVKASNPASKLFRVSAGLIALAALFFVDISQMFWKMQNEESVKEMKRGLMADTSVSTQAGKIKSVGWVKSASVSRDTGWFVVSAKTENGASNFRSLVINKDRRWVYIKSEELR
jgi:uncharacterized RDD family membrane protein YckC